MRVLMVVWVYQTGWDGMGWDGMEREPEEEAGIDITPECKIP